MTAAFIGAGRTAIPNGNLGQPFVGFSESVCDQSIAGAIAAAGGTFDLPGPAAGFTHRIYDLPRITSNTLAAPFTAPGISSAYNALLTASSGATGATSVLPDGFILAAGETYRFTNGSAANAGRIWAQYYDVYMPTWTVVRATLTAAAADIIPAPPAGFVRRYVVASLFTTVTRSVSVRSTVYNADTIAHSVEYLLGANLIARTSSIAAAVNNIQVPGPITVTVASGALRARTAAAVAVTPPNIFLTYDTIALPLP